MEEEIKKNLWNLLKGKITFEEYLTGRIRWFFSWENVKSFIFYLFMLSLGLILFQIAEKNYENHQECLVGHQAMTMCDGKPAAISCQVPIQQISNLNITESINQNKST